MTNFPLSVEIMKAIQVKQIRKSTREEDRDMEEAEKTPGYITSLIRSTMMKKWQRMS